MTQDKLAQFMAVWLGKELGREISANAEFAALGLDSLDMVRMMDAVAVEIGVDELPISLVFDHPSVSKLAAHLAT
jgi:polyketide synthase 7